MQKRQHEKVVKSKVAAQKWLWWSDNGKNLNNNISGKFVLPSPTGNQHQNSPEMLLLKFCNYQITTATSGPPPLISQLFHAAFFARATPFLQFRYFCVDFTPFCNLTCIFAFTGYS